MRVVRRYLVSGRVQGVGFRYFAGEAGRRECLDGTVRNLSDGRVEILCEGEADAVERFERAIRQGPPAARVDDVQIDLSAPGPRGLGFHIR